MSEPAGDTLARLRSVYERWGRGDFNTPEIFHPEVSTVWDSAIPGVGRVAYEGVVWWFEDGLAVRLVGFIEPEPALRLAGLDPGAPQ